MRTCMWLSWLTSGVTTSGRPGERQVRADVDRHRAGVHEHVQQRLGEAHVDLADGQRGALAAVAARVVDVGVEAVLVRRVADPAADLRAEVAAVAQAQVADADPRGVRVAPRELAQHV